ncbi:OmpA family protein [Roseicitreum antarcticum]|uniref:OmpA-OmpF porin, OOP family n=1 Tax=Roseicitreum antarcticum TaxID=564137 RepID=A0A1H3AZG8_9RHOB|nr:OmpA family protein [Roseicitreum antarcticum]SDX35126.1 OmpA-OmpF porin, OOP family [Roseicitreum antarcticum]
MKVSRTTMIGAGVFVVAAFMSLVLGYLSVRGVERVTKGSIEGALEADDMDWARVRTDGLLVSLSGTSPTEADRFHALTLANAVVDATRVIDLMTVADTAGIEGPRFQMELLRNSFDVSIIGLVPAAFGNDAVIDSITDLAPDMAVADMLEVADYPTPPDWDRAVGFALDALELLNAAKISIAADGVHINALADSTDHRTDLETQIGEMVPDGLQVTLEITAPLPVITPFTLRFTVEEGAARFDACSADTTEARDQILAAAQDAGLRGRPTCTLGLGTPTPRWAQAAASAIAEVGALGAGSVTMSDTDMSLVVPHTVAQQAFDQSVGALEGSLPDVFSLESVRLPAPDTQAVSPADAIEFIATLSPEGQVLLRGRLTDERIRSAVNGYARARFGMQAVQMSARLDPDLPEGWPLRALAALEALAELHNGLAHVRPDRIEVRGVSGNTDSSDVISRVLSEKLGQGTDLRIDVRYDETLDPAFGAPTPASCEADIAAVLADRQITFDPGSASIDADTGEVLDRIADILRECGEIEMEVAGYTDSQGRAETNLALSQRRAEAVVNSLMTRRVLVSGLLPVGFGQEDPIADNATAEGREANRRIEFRRVVDPAEEVPAEAERDPELEAGLEITVSTPGEDTIRPRARPARDEDE